MSPNIFPNMAHETKLAMSQKMAVALGTDTAEVFAALDAADQSLEPKKKDPPKTIKIPIPNIELPSLVHPIDPKEVKEMKTIIDHLDELLEESGRPTIGAQQDFAVAMLQGKVKKDDWKDFALAHRLISKPGDIVRVTAEEISSWTVQPGFGLLRKDHLVAVAKLDAPNQMIEYTSRIRPDGKEKIKCKYIEKVHIDKGTHLYVLPPGSVSRKDKSKWEPVIALGSPWTSVIVSGSPYRPADSQHYVKIKFSNGREANKEVAELAWDNSANAIKDTATKIETIKPGSAVRVLRNNCGAHRPSLIRTLGSRWLEPGDIITVKSIRGQSVCYALDALSGSINSVGIQDVELVTTKELHAFQAAVKSVQGKELLEKKVEAAKHDELKKKKEKEKTEARKKREEQIVNTIKREKHKAKAYKEFNKFAESLLGQYGKIWLRGYHDSSRNLVVYRESPRRWPTALYGFCAVVNHCRPRYQVLATLDWHGTFAVYDPEKEFPFDEVAQKLMECAKPLNIPVRLRYQKKQRFTTNISNTV